MSRPLTGFAAVDPPDRWTPTRGRFRPERLEAPIDSLTGVGPTLKKRLAKLGLEHVGDLLDHRPRRYERPAPEKRIADLFGDEEVLIEGDVVKTSLRRGRGRLQILTAQVSDGSGQISATWFNQPWLKDKLTPGTHVRLRGQQNRFGFAVRSFDLNGGSATADFAPVYPASEEVSAVKLRELVESALPLATDRPDPLPASLKAERGLPLRGDALAALHRPRSLDEAEYGRRRLAFDELLVLQLALARRAAEREEQVAAALPGPGELIERYRAVLPFELTEHQEGAIAEIDRDLARTTPMQRLLQGDVGSGKTVVALYALLRAVEVGRQGALMAPTETLAEQHFLTIEGICAELGVSCALVTGSVKSKIGGQADVVVGTHALIQKGFEFRDLAVAVVDEQHRFGVEQRSALTEGRAPHVLHMTATPIPRTLALTVYGDLSVSEIAKPPASRKPIVTAWVTDERSSEAYTRLRAHLAEGRQAYVVCPLIEESATSTARAAEQEAEALRAGELQGLPRRLHARAPQAGGAPRADGALQRPRARRARRDDRDRGRRRRPERDDHDRPGGRPLRSRPAAPAPRTGRARGGAVVLPAHLRPEGGADGERARPARGARGVDRRLRARREGSRDPRRRRAARRAPVGALRPPLRADHEGPRAARGSARHGALAPRPGRWRRRSRRCSAAPSTWASPRELGLRRG